MSLSNNIRTKKVFFVSECILNQNIRAYGVGNMQGSGTVYDIVDLINKSGFGISVVPCPEIPYEGLKRNARNKDSYDNDVYRSNCARLAKQLIIQYKMYIEDDYKVGGFICVNGSPSCAIDYCFRGDKVSEKCLESGVFIEELKKELIKNNLELDFIGMRIKDMHVVLEKIKSAIERLECTKI